MIFCEFNLCIYNQKNECKLKTISISALGTCDNCLLPDFDDEELEKLKKDTLQMLESKN